MSKYLFIVFLFMSSDGFPMIVKFCFNTVAKHSSKIKDYINMTKHSINYQRKALSILLILLKHATPLTFNTYLRAINYYYNIYFFFTIKLNYFNIKFSWCAYQSRHSRQQQNGFDTIGFWRQCVFLFRKVGAGLFIFGNVS